MNKYIVTSLFFFFLFLSKAVHAVENIDYIPKNQSIKNFVAKNELHNYAYQLLRYSKDASELDSEKDFYLTVEETWCKFRKLRLSQSEKKEELTILLYYYSEYLPLNLLEKAYALGLKNRPYYWEDSNKRLGTTFTSLLKVGTLLTVISSLVICPAAATINLKGTFRESCVNIKTNAFTSSDPKIQGQFISLLADCPYDRQSHGFKVNSIVLPEGGPCNYIHNNNGSLIATDEPNFRLESASVANGNIPCPELTGSFKITCGSISSTSYQSPDNQIPPHSICQYQVAACQKIGGEKTKDNTLYISKAEVQCQGSRIENCDGDLKIRKMGQSDSQCQGKKSKIEL